MIRKQNKIKKKEDLFPLLMLTMNVVTKIINQGKIHMSPFFLPLTLLLESIFTEHMTRQKRLRFITISFLIFWIYFHEITETHGFNLMFLFDKIFCEKFLSLCLSFSIIIAKNTKLHLGALGTHFLEHYFGKVGRLCKMDDSSNKFEYSDQISIIIQL